MLSLLYVSRSLLSQRHGEAQLAAIVALAAPRNLRAGVTGALIHTPTNFAQVLEGPQQAVEAIMGSILVDPRHAQVNIVGRAAIRQRRFPNWGMAVVDRDVDTQRHIDQIFVARTEASFQEGVEGLTRWLEQSASARLGSAGTPGGQG